MVHKPVGISKDDWNLVVGSAKIRNKKTGEFILYCVKKILEQEDR